MPPKKKNSQPTTQKFSKNLATSKRKSIELKYERGKEWYKSIFIYFLKVKNIEQYSRYKDQGVSSIAERVIRTLRKLWRHQYF